MSLSHHILYNSFKKRTSELMSQYSPTHQGTLRFLCPKCQQHFLGIPNRQEQTCLSCKLVFTPLKVETTTYYFTPNDGPTTKNELVTPVAYKVGGDKGASPPEATASLGEESKKKICTHCRRRSGHTLGCPNILAGDAVYYDPGSPLKEILLGKASPEVWSTEMPDTITHLRDAISHLSASELGEVARRIVMLYHDMTESDDNWNADMCEALSTFATEGIKEQGNQTSKNVKAAQEVIAEVLHNKPTPPKEKSPLGYFPLSPPLAEVVKDSLFEEKESCTPFSSKEKYDPQPLAPPIGILPFNLWVEDRITNLQAAIERYETAPPAIREKPIAKWKEELKTLRNLFNPLPPKVIAQLEFRALEAVKALMNAEHYDHFESRCSDSEMEAVSEMRKINNEYKSL